LKAISQQGLLQCTMSDVAEAAGVSKGILHYYFKSKSEMISALVALIRDSRFLEFKTSLAEIKSPREKFSASMRYPLSAFDLRADADLSKTMAKVWIEFWALAAHHQDVQDLILDLHRSLRKHYVEIIEEGIKSGEFRQDADPKVIASSILAAYQGLMLQWHFDSPAIDFAKHVDLLVEVFLDYLTKTAK
jgi:AcrR family transcriptional regulator